MKRSLRDDARFATRRRGVTLVEMLVTLAILLLMMTAIVQDLPGRDRRAQRGPGLPGAGQPASPARLDDPLRPERRDCKLTPPNNPKNNLGYLEYGENEFADVQGEDSDDYIRFTAKAPAGQPFTGRMWIRAAGASPVGATQPASPADHDHQRVRRDHLLPAQWQSLPSRAAGGTGAAVDDRAVGQQRQPQPQPSQRRRLLPGRPGRQPGEPQHRQNQVSWQAVNDLSAHPATSGTPVPRQLGHPQHPGRPDQPREPALAYQRFADDFLDLTGAPEPRRPEPTTSTATTCPTTIPTLYPTVLLATPSTTPASSSTSRSRPIARALGAMAFPFVFPGAYSRPQNLAN